GWHIYWKNPGDSGQPPLLRWVVPPGFAAGSTRWPRPMKLQHSSIADYGYEDDVTLLLPLRVSSSAKNGSRAEIVLNAKWLICSEVCLPEKAQLRLSLPIAASGKEDKTSAKEFADARKLLPRPWPASWSANAASAKDRFVVTIQSGKPLQG